MPNLFTTQTVTQDISLASGQTHSLQLQGPMQVSICQGLVWLTLEEGGADIWLQRGQRFDLPASGLAVFEAAKGAARLQLQPAQERRRATGIMRLLPQGLMRWS